MNVHELPMILFTVIAQMCVGSFVVLGFVQALASRKFSAKAVDELADPALFAIGPALVLGLAVSTLHMNDLLHTFNVFRHLGGSWLSAEITFGVLFAVSGFAFAFLQWRKLGNPRLRQVLAIITAVLGLCLVYAMSMIYYSLQAVPAWHSWGTPFQFFTTTILLGCLAVGTAFVSVSMWRNRKGITLDDQSEVDSLLGRSLRWIALVGLLAGGAVLVGMPMYVAGLAAQGGVAAQSAATYVSWMFAVRLLLVVFGAGLMGMFIFFMASTQMDKLKPLAIMVTVGFALVLVAELIGRAQFYESMLRVGM